MLYEPRPWLGVGSITINGRGLSSEAPSEAGRPRGTPAHQRYAAPTDSDARTSAMIAERSESLMVF